MSVAFAMLWGMDPADLIARVVVDVPARALSEPFDYAVPDDLETSIAVGCPVAVQLGSRRCVGYVVDLVRHTDFQGALKPIDAILGMRLFDEHALSLASWISEEYLAPLSEALRLFLPPGGAPRAVQSADGWTYKGSQMKVRSERLVMRAEESEFVPVAHASVQRAVLDAISEGPVTVSELSAEISGAAAAVKSLERAGAVTTIERRLFRRPAGASAEAPHHRHTAEQASALRAISHTAKSGGGVILLDGVTGSGKTEVYLAAIESVISAGRSAIVLVPEISLTPQTVGRFRYRLGDDVAVIHSRLSAGERFDQWQLALEGKVRVVVGARSALFAPMRDVGLVVIDEEHEPSYKQGQSPRYHARDVAERLCAARGATLVLGSATPSMESIHRADSGVYRRCVLSKRVGGGAPPRVDIVDMTAEFADGHRSIYSRALQEALRTVAERGEKAVLFLNRRGFASFLLCRECGFVPECESCSVSLTYHEDVGQLQCHHCGSSRVIPSVCPKCGSAYLRKFGAGTQRAQAELASLMPGLPIVRMDADTTALKGGHESALRTFEEHASAVLLGTQMISKGLDYPDVTLVGVLNADTSMHLPDFRAGERTYQLLEQVAGRAGRGPKPGRVIIQTYWASHPAVQAVASQDSELLYRNERADRSALGFPPFGRIVNVLLSGRSASDVREDALLAARALTDALPEGWQLVGPSAAPITRLKGKWRWHMLVKAPADARVSAAVGNALKNVPVTEGVTRIVDVDPIGML
ncbi:MAG: primosomal protein N' [Coriobacteriia bacterium]|nr:primosomal protein N' [Coriobacteriia bacterium]